LYLLCSCSIVECMIGGSRLSRLALGVVVASQLLFAFAPSIALADAKSDETARVGQYASASFKLTSDAQGIKAVGPGLAAVSFALVPGSGQLGQGATYVELKPGETTGAQACSNMPIAGGAYHMLVATPVGASSAQNTTATLSSVHKQAPPSRGATNRPACPLSNDGSVTPVSITISPAATGAIDGSGVNVGPTAEQMQTMTIQDRSHFLYLGRTFIDGQIDGHDFYTSDSPVTECAGHQDDIAMVYDTGSSTIKSLTAHVWGAVQRGGCSQVTTSTIPPQGDTTTKYSAGGVVEFQLAKVVTAENIHMSLQWVYKKLIKSTDERYSFSLDTDNVYQRDSQPSCKDLLVRQSDATTGRFTERSNDIGSYDRFYFDNMSPITQKTNNGCSERDPYTVRIAHPERAALDAPPAGTLTNDSSAVNCTIEGVLGWILCPLLRAAADAYNTLSQYIIDFLQTGPLTNSSYGVAILALNSMKNIANGLFVLIFVVIIFSNTLSIGLNSYAIKKMLPRLVVAAILVQFSLPILQLMFDINNIIGSGIADIIALAVNQGGQAGGASTTDIVLSLGLLIGAGAITVSLALIVPVLLMVFAAVMGIVAVFVTLALRKFMLTALVIMAPLAFVAWILPNTEQYFKMWWKTLVRLLLMYPIIQGMFSLARIGSQIVTTHAVGGTGAGGSFSENNVGAIFAAILPIIAFYRVPATFKWAGQGMDTIAGAVSGRFNKLGSNKMTKGIAKGAADKRREGAMMGYGSAGRLGRAKARVMTGNVFNGKQGARKMNAGYSSTLDTLAKEQSEGVKAMNSSQLQAAASGVGAGLDPAVQKAALDHMVSQGDWDGLRAVQDKDPTNKMLSRVVSANFGAIKGKAGDITEMHKALSGKTPEEQRDALAGKSSQEVRAQAVGSLLNGMSPDDFAGQHHSTFEQFARSSTIDSSVNEMSRRHRDEVAGNSRLSSQISSKSMDTLHGILAPGSPMAAPTGTPVAGTATSGPAAPTASTGGPSLTPPPTSSTGGTPTSIV
jgi:hypothetical protein